jgi:hypothetical protein
MSITASIEMPSRHPKAVPLKSVMVNSQPWIRFDKDKEIIELRGLSGKVVVAASY